MTLMMPAKKYDWRLEEALQFPKGPEFVSLTVNRHRLNSTGLSISAFLRLVPAISRKTMTFVGGFTGAPNDGEGDRWLLSKMVN